MPRQPASKAKKTLYAQEVRMETFRGTKMAHSKSRAKVRWPHIRPTPESMALAGLYFEPEAKNPDRVTCYVCGTSFDGWEEDDDPTHEHYQFAPECALAKIQYKPWEYEDDFDLASSPFNPHSEGIVNARLETYGELWPHEKSHGWMCSSFNMAKAGLYFNPLGPDDDDASCAYCSVTLGGWDPTDNPLEEHRRRSAECKFFTTEPPINTRNSSVEPESLAAGLRSESEAEQEKVLPIEEAVVKPSPPRSRGRPRKRQSEKPESDVDAEEKPSRTRSRSRSVAKTTQKLSSKKAKSSRPTRVTTKTRLSVFDDDDAEMTGESDDLELDPKPLKAVAVKPTKAKSNTKTGGRSKAKTSESEHDDVDDNPLNDDDGSEDEARSYDGIEDRRPESSVDASVEAELERLEKSVKLGNVLPSLAPSPETSKLFAQLDFNGPSVIDTGLVSPGEKKAEESADDEDEDVAHDTVLHHGMEQDANSDEHEIPEEEDQKEDMALEDADELSTAEEEVQGLQEEKPEGEPTPIEVDEVDEHDDVINLIPGGYPSPVHHNRTNTTNSSSREDTTIKAPQSVPKMSLADNGENDGSETLTVVAPVPSNKNKKKRSSQSVSEPKVESVKKQRKTTSKKINSSNQRASTLLAGLAGDDEDDEGDEDEEEDGLITDKRTSHVSQMRLSQNWTRFGDSSPEAENKNQKAFALDDEDSSKQPSPERRTGAVAAAASPEAVASISSSSESEGDKENMPPTPPQKSVNAAATPKQVRIVDARDDEPDGLFDRFDLLDPDSALDGDGAQIDLSGVKEDCLDMTLMQFFTKLADQSVAGIEGEFQKKTDLVRDQGLRAILAIEGMPVSDA